MGIEYRQAGVADIPVLMEIRNAVKENALVTTVLTAADYERAMTEEGRAWLCEVDGRVAGFSCGRTEQGDIWALFVREEYEGRGIGRELLALAEEWMFSEGLDSIWLVTSPDTRAERLYRHLGWEDEGAKPSGEVAFRRRRPS